MSVKYTSGKWQFYPSITWMSMVILIPLIVFAAMNFELSVVIHRFRKVTYGFTNTALINYTSTRFMPTLRRFNINSTNTNISMIKYKHYQNMSVTQSEIKPPANIMDPDLNIIPKLIWHFGYAVFTDFHDSFSFLMKHPGTEESSTLQHVPEKENLSQGDLIYFQGRQLNHFVNKLLPKYESESKHFSLLLATNTDFTMPLNFYQEGLYQKSIQILMKSDKMLYMFCINFDGLSWNYTDWTDISKNRIHPVPLGLDYHTPMKGHIRHSTVNKYKNFDLPWDLENKIFKIIDDINARYYTCSEKSENCDKKIFKIFLDYQLNLKQNDFSSRFELLANKGAKMTQNLKTSQDILSMYRLRSPHKNEYRSWILSQILSIKAYQNMFEIDDQHRSVTEGFIERSKYVFSLILFGNGLDTHRMYEALLLDAIVITFQSPLDILFKLHNLPVVSIQNTTQINQTMLQYWYKKYKDKTYLQNENTRQVLTTKYWINYMRVLTNDKLKKLKLKQN